MRQANQYVGQEPRENSPGTPASRMACFTCAQCWAESHTIHGGEMIKSSLVTRQIDKTSPGVRQERNQSLYVAGYISGGLVVERRTPNREVLGSIPTSGTILCP